MFFVRSCRDAHPVLHVVNLENLEVVGEQSLLHGLLHRVDDAGGDEDAVLFKERGDDAGEWDDHVREDVGDDDIVAFSVIFLVEALRLLGV